MRHITRQDIGRSIIGNEEPSLWIRGWFIPWGTNAAIWAITVTAVAVNRMAENKALFVGPMPSSEYEIFFGLADSRTVIWPLAAVLGLVVVAWLLNLRPYRSRKGRKRPRYFLRQVGEELRSFTLNASSILLITSHYTSSRSLLYSAIGCWLAWSVLQWGWLRRNGNNLLDS